MFTRSGRLLHVNRQSAVGQHRQSSAFSAFRFQTNYIVHLASHYNRIVASFCVNVATVGVYDRRLALNPWTTAHNIVDCSIKSTTGYKQLRPATQYVAVIRPNVVHEDVSEVLDAITHCIIMRCVRRGPMRQLNRPTS